MERVNSRMKLTTLRERNRGVMMTDLEYIAENLSEEDILCQIAEEAAELAQAALKLRRAITGTNPTPVTMEEALDSFFEEYGDVEGACAVFTEKKRLNGKDVFELLARQIESKYNRWAQRIKEGKKHD